MTQITPGQTAMSNPSSHAPSAGAAASGARGETQPCSQFTTPADADRPLIWVNGELKPKSQAMVSVYDHGLLYGDGVFEGIRVYNGRIFKHEQHLDRLWRSAEAIRLEIPVSRDEMTQIERRCVEANEITDGYIRLVVTRGVGTLGLNPFKCPTAGIICIADQIALYPPELYEQGMKVVIAERPRVPIECLDPRVKSLNYLNNIMAKCEAIDRGLLEAIMLNTEGYVSECTGDNIFAVKDGKIFTPPSEAGILEGITRRFIMDTIAPQCGYEIEERMIRPEELLTADEVFLTGSAAEMIAVTGIITKDAAGEDTTHEISQGEGSVTREMRMKFREIVTSDNVPED